MSKEHMMNSTDQTYYGIYTPLLLRTQETMQQEIARILHALSPDAEHAPAEHVVSRIKCAESAEEKLKRRGLPGGAASGLAHLTDLVGVRVVAHFVGDVYAILEEIQKSGCWEVFQIKDYIAAPKPNGYRSLHVLVRVPAANIPNALPACSSDAAKEQFTDKVKPAFLTDSPVGKSSSVETVFDDETSLTHITAEIQLRTVAMDCWASLEHQLKYKKNIENTALIVSELKRCADEMASTDLTMQTLREMIREENP